MKIGEKEYKDITSDCWLVFPSSTLTINVWTEAPNTYLITEPIYLKELESLLESNFLADFEIKEIENIDSTLLENDIPLEIFNQVIQFNEPNLFRLKRVQIQGNTLDETIIQVDTETTFEGFEIWKMDDYKFYWNKIESSLKTIAVKFSTIDDVENNLIRIKLRSNN
ncbi:hypothetical protein [Adhaeribacter rhizoryzae]|uniref:Uncharacterized protein n=1 Tax=Adhaeribacter rhizoryzae TaxID=2607907 RepID=A0A5M6DC40_9BACT|nr:hypothetical protein [Adhaeribacter rhizoryzae]KAA5543950.1 hypothetical protein F0145_15330 [Adhaeribacter rhizoryzae]